MTSPLVVGAMRFCWGSSTNGRPQSLHFWFCLPLWIRPFLTMFRELQLGQGRVVIIDGGMLNYPYIWWTTSGISSFRQFERELLFRTTLKSGRSALDDVKQPEQSGKRYVRDDWHDNRYSNESDDEPIRRYVLRNPWWHIVDQRK